MRRLAVPEAPGFTLIELLIVVAIIAILAAIAVPNFLEAQVRSKVSAVRSDMRAIATALEAYRIEENHYPVDRMWYAANGHNPPPDFVTDLWRLTTPVAFLSSIPPNRFVNRWSMEIHPLGDAHRKAFDYRTSYGWGEQITTPGGKYFSPTALFHKQEMRQWAVISVGPDQQVNYGEFLLFGDQAIYDLRGEQKFFWGNTTGEGALYDPTNGSLSQGDIARSGP